MSDLTPQIDEMLRNLEMSFLHKARIDANHLAVNVKALEVAKERNKILQELVDEIRRLRITGIQP